MSCVIFYFFNHQDHGTNPNPSPYEISVEVPPKDITGVKWLENSNIVYHCWVSYIIVFFKTMEPALTLTLTLTHTDVRATAFAAEIAVAIAADFRGHGW